jgi:hypothetical protein
MFYDFPLSIPANTPSSFPVEDEVKLTYGVITHVEVEFPPGCAGLAYGRILHEGHQVWPTDPASWFRSDGRAIVWNERYELLEVPYTMVIQGYNDDDTFPHELIFRFEVLPPEAVTPPSEAVPLLTRIARFLGVGK